MSGTDGVPVIEVETQPRQLLHEARDWGELLITRQLAEPLFFEIPKRGIATRVFEVVKRTDSHTWRLGVDDSIAWSDGRQVLARDICEQVKRVRASGSAAAVALTLIETVRIVEDRTVELKTRLPVGDIRRLFTSPALGLSHEAGASCGAFILQRRLPDRLILRHTVSGNRLALMTLPDHRGLRAAAKAGALAVTSLVTGSSVARQRLGYRLSEADLDIVVGLKFPATMPGELVERFMAAMDRTRLVPSNLGVLRPLTRLSELWRRTSAAESPSAADNPSAWQCGRSWVLTYNDFYPNRQIADSLAVQVHDALGIALRLVVVPYWHSYSDAGPLPQHTLRLVLVTPAWVHPAALLTPVALARRRRGEAPDDFDVHFPRALAAEQMPDAARHAAHAERQLRPGELPLLPLARLRAQVAHRAPAVWIPPSGWIDFSAFLNSQDTHICGAEQ